MRKRIVENYVPRLDEKRLLDIVDYCQYTSQGRTKAMQLAKEQGFEVRIGSRVLYDRRKIDKWCNEQTGIDA